MTDIDRIRAARTRAAGKILKTPVLSSPALDAVAGRRLLVKAECLQYTGSFKARGGWSAISAMDPETRARGILAYSSGNHAQGVARAAQAFGVPAVIIMPADAPQSKIDGTKSYGAEVVTYDRETESREDIGAALSAERGLTLVRPYDQPDVIAGQGTVGLEIAEQTKGLELGPTDVIVCAGGGGLASGIALALEAEARHLRVRTSEPVGFDDVARSLVSGKRESNERLSGSVCDAILTPCPGELTFPILSRLAGPGLTITDEEAMRAVALAFRHLKIVVEPGGAAGLAAALFRRDQIEGDTVIAVATGGNVDTARFSEAILNY
ncbi:threonine ammonia-lyase [Amaricoccus tamworthensis]|uniref:threonine ammonia-lyase n=1 Tax=Amaricoccus tamworthensis TaxID=57002 RepID=UPI003C797BFE